MYKGKRRNKGGNGRLEQKERRGTSEEGRLKRRMRRRGQRGVVRGKGKEWMRRRQRRRRGGKEEEG